MHENKRKNPIPLVKLFQFPPRLLNFQFITFSWVCLFWPRCLTEQVSDVIAKPLRDRKLKTWILTIRWNFKLVVIGQHFLLSGLSEFFFSKKKNWGRGVGGGGSLFFYNENNLSLSVKKWISLNGLSTIFRCWRMNKQEHPSLGHFV